MFKILTLNQIAVRGLERLPRQQFEIASEFSAPDAILLRSHKLQPESISPSVRAIARAGAGVNNIPVAWCTEHGIPVFNTPGANANAVKELVLAGLVLGSRGVLDGVSYVDGQRELRDAATLSALLEKEKMRFKGNELAGKMLGIVGLGAIGSMVADAALALGMQVIGYDPALSVEAAWRLPREVGKIDNLSVLFARADYITLHLPVLDSTRGLVNRELLANCRPGVRLLNFAREELVEEPALIEALDSGRVARYISDFPTPALIGRSDVVLTPHIGASTDEAEENCAVMAADQLREFLINGSVRNSVNFPTLQLDRTTEVRLAIANRNVPGMLGQLLSILAEARINVGDMLNKSRDEIAYNLIDIEQRPDDNLLQQMRAVAGVINVRLINHLTEESNERNA